MSLLTEVQEQTKKRTIRDVIAVLDVILDDQPGFTGLWEIHVKEGTALKLFARRQYNILDDS